MKDRIILELVPKKQDGPDDFLEKFVVDYSYGRPVDLSPYEVRICDSIVDNYREDIIEEILKTGFSSFITSELITEALVSNRTTTNQIAELIKRFLVSIEISTDILIVDPYFFAGPLDQDYLQLVETIFEPFIQNLKTFRIITLPTKVHVQTKQEITHYLKDRNPRVRIIHKHSSIFHDRFWLNQINRKGFLSGSSLNGLGKRYALIDYLQQNDVDDVINALTANSLC